MGNKKMIIGLGSILLMGTLIFVLMVKSVEQEGLPDTQEATSVNTPTKTQKSITASNEITLQKQVHDILAKGTVADCVIVNDVRYERLCKELFRTKK
jgi:hypothetical protein